MSSKKRAVAALAASALIVPLSPFGSPALADHIDPRPITTACPPDQTPPRFFSDVPEGSLFDDNINCIAGYAVANGFSEEEYKPGLVVTREQMAQFIYRIGLRADMVFDTETDPGFDDIQGPGDTSSPEAQDAIFGLANAGIVNGFDSGAYEPGDPVTRAQMAAFILRLQIAVGVDEGTYETTTDFFDDDDGSFFEADINAIASEGVTVGNGSQDRAYGPANLVNRGEMAAFLSRKIEILVVQGVVVTRFPLYDQLSMSEDGSLTRVVSPNPDVTTADDRTYTVEGVVPGVEYRVTLLESSFVTGDGQDAVFTDTEPGPRGDHLAEVGSPQTDITEVNGQAPRDNGGLGTEDSTTPVTSTAVVIAPDSGTFTFVIDGDAPESVRPVVHRNGGGEDNLFQFGGTSPRLELARDDTAVEAFALGGVTVFEAPAAPGGPGGP